MSSFRRVGRGTKSSPSSNKSPPFASARGVKAWTGGIHLVSVGLQELDNVLGGGQPLGTSLLLKEDRWTRDLASSILKYWCAEAISQEHELIIPTHQEEESDQLRSTITTESGGNSCRDEIEDMLMSLPRNLHWDKQKKKENKYIVSGGLDVLVEDDDEEEIQEEGLEIAWQYKKSVQQERLGVAQPVEQKKAVSETSNTFCHSYDLSGKMKEQTVIEPSRFISSVNLKSKSGLGFFHELVGLLKKKDGKPTRILLYHLQVDLLAVALPLLLSYIRENSLPVVLLAYSSPCNDAKSWSRLSRTCDVVLSTEGFSSRISHPPPPEFSHLRGILTITKVCTVTASSANGGGNFGDISISKKPAAFIYGFKRDRRKLHLTLLHIPPEDFAQGGGSVGSGVRSGAGKERKQNKSLGCSSNISGSALDF